MPVETPQETTLMKVGAGQTLIKRLADKYEIEAGKFLTTVISTVFTAGKAKQGEEARPGRGLPPTESMVSTFLIVCNQYDLNPFIKEIYPFIDGEGNLKIVIGVDGWIKVALRQDQYDGHEFAEHMDADGNLVAVTCSVFRKDRNRPIKMVEYMKECKMATKPWEQWPYRMLHHKAFIQACRYAFGMGDLTDEDELDRIKHVKGGSHDFIEEPRRLSEQPRLAPVAATPEPAPPTPVKPRAEEPAAASDLPADEHDVKRVWEIAFPKGLSKVEVNAMVKKQFGVDRVQNLSKKHIEILIADLKVF